MCEKEKLFLELVEGFQWKYNLEKYPNSLFLSKNKKDIIQIFNISSINKKKIIASYRLGIKQDLKGSAIRTSREFALNFDMEQNEYKRFVVDMFSKHLKIKIAFLWYTT